MNTNAANEKIGIVERAGYCGLEVGLQFAWTMISTYLAVFYTDVVGLAPAVVSMILLGARIWDGVNDPMMGAIAEKTNTRWGKYRPYLLFAAPLLCIFSILTFTNTGMTGTGAVVFATVTYVLCGMAYTAVSISEGSIVNVMTRDSHTRVQLNSLRQMGNGITGLVLGLVAMPLILFFGKGSTGSASGYFWANVVFALIGMACILFGGFVCRERVTVTHHDDSASLGKSFLYVLRNRNVLLLAVNGIFTAGAILGRMGALAYYFIYYIGNPALMAPTLTIYNIVTILVQTLVPSLVKKVGKKKACVISYTIQTISMLIIWFGGSSSILWVYVGSAVMGVSNFAPAVLYSLNGDVVDREEVQTGHRSDGLAYSMLGLGTKIGIAVGGAVATGLLGVIGYVPNAEQSVETLRGLNNITNLYPIVFVVLAAVTVLMMDITDEEAARNKVILEERHSAQKQ